eukprot:6191700-Pleurochrysis_carterae.AAC.2
MSAVFRPEAAGAVSGAEHPLHSCGGHGGAASEDSAMLGASPTYLLIYSRARLRVARCRRTRPPTTPPHSSRRCWEGRSSSSSTRA